MKLGAGQLVLENPGARLRVLLLHHAGGSAMSLLPLAKRLQADCEPVLLELPGRGLRSAEPPAPDFAAALEVLLPEVTAAVDRPTLILGHSLGALIAHSLAVGLPERERERVRAVVVSAFPAPAVAARVATHPAEPFRVRTREQLLVELQDRGGCPPEVFEDQDTLEHAVTLMGQDLHLADTYRPPPAGAGNAAAYHVWFGRDDPHLAPEELQEWAAATGLPPIIREFPGEHFYLLRSEQAGQALRALVTDLS
ncbi:thioesterase II family protein [Amycolatopsis aidingensis]|uniref:thioesterase II family protein n=1 Tax=Amycolatopsis aidingensis TaxID=2842453 RepID=UPI001C0DDCDC|nr:alpha/beta fold hydrolase [Amycolatopsis aidingensis]